MELLKAEGGRPYSGASFDMPDVSLKMPRFSLPKFGRKSSGDVNLEGYGTEGDIDISPPRVDGEGRPASVEIGGFHAPDVTIKMPKFSMPGFGSKETDFDRSGHSAELDAKGKVKIPSVDISLPAAKTSEQEMLLPKAEVDVSEADISGYEGNLKIPKMPTIDVSAPHIDLDVTLPKVKHETNIDGEGGKFKMPNIKMPDIDLSLPIGKTGDIDASKVKIEGGGGKFKMPGIKMPKVDISLPKVKHGEIDVSKVEIEGECGKFKKPHMEMPNFDISLPKGKSGGFEGTKMEIEGGGGNFKMPHMKMPKVDFSLPKGKHGDISAPEMEMEGEGGKFKMPYIKMPNIDISLPKGKSGDIEGPQMEIEGGGGKCKMPHMKIPNVDISLPKGKTGDVNAPIPHMKMANIALSLPKRKSGGIEGPDMKIPGEGGKLKMPHMKIPKVDLSIPKGKSGDISAPEIEMEGEGGTFKMKMQNIDVSRPKGKTGDIEGPEMEMEGRKFKMPHMKMPNVDISLPKGKRKFKTPHMKMPNIDISLPKGKGVEMEGPEMDIEGKGGKFKMPHMTTPNIGISLPKGKTGDVNAPELEIEGEGGIYKIPEIKLPKIDITLPKGKSDDIDAEIKQPNAEAEGKIQMPSIGLPKFTTPDLDLDMNVGKPNHGAEVHGKNSDKTGSHLKGDHKMKIKMPTIDIECPKGDLELDIGFHKVEGKKDRKRIELPDVDLKTSGTKVKGPKVKGTKFKIGMPKMNNTGDQALDAATKKTEKENEGVSGRFMIKKTKLGKGADVEADAEAGVSVLPNIFLPDVGFSVSKGASQEGEPHGPEISAKLPKFKLPNVEISGPSVTGQGGSQINSGQQEDKGGIKFQMPVGLKSKQGSAEPTGTDASTENGFTLLNLGIKAPKIPDIDFDIGASQTGDHGADTSTRQKIKIPKFGVALPAISSPEARVHLKDPEVECEGPKIAALSIEGDVDGDDKSKGAKLKMPKVTFSPGKTGSFDVTLKGEGSSSSLNGEKDPTFQNGSKEDKAKLGKLKLPKIEFSSPYSKIGTDGETKGTKVKSGKMSFPGFKKKTAKGEEETQDNVVSSSARTEMLDRDSSESPTPMVSIGFVPGKSRGQAEAESSKKETEEGEQSTWFKAPKFNLKPHSTGILHITPEGSTQGSRSSLQCQGLDETAGNFRLQMPSMRFSTQEVSEENVTTTKEGTVTVMTKTTKHTVTESRTGQTHTSLSHCNY
uniref:AHNAK nucleoprotein n=1 Tax=Hucho hucho TaxID=62062 RepID=A0A4W5NR61_9TELE